MAKAKINWKKKRCKLEKQIEAQAHPIPMLLTCPTCRACHIDEGKFATYPHHTQ